jgi:hypothetical protein
MVKSFGLSGLTVRWLWALFLVLATYNPSGHSYLHWLFDSTDPRWSLKVLLGMMLCIANLAFLLASLRSLGLIGMASAMVFFVTLVWVLLDQGYLHDLSFWTWVTLALVLLGSVLAIGVSWSYIRSRLSGQTDTNDVTLR